MAKKNGTWKIIGTIVTLLVIGAGLVVNYTLQGAAVASTSTRINELDEEGCDPANKSLTRIAILEVQQEHTREDIKEIKGDVKEILKAVKEK